MRKALLVSLFFVATTLTSATTALAGHYFATITWPINSAAITGPCHGGPFYFVGWGRECPGAYDIGNGGSSASVYIRGANWSTATITAAYGNFVYTATTCDGSIFREYGNRWEVTLADGTAGAAFHHLSNYHYAPVTTVSNGEYVADQANWPLYPVFYCDGQLASTAAHIHMEAARNGNLVDTWESTRVKYTHGP